MSYLDVAFSFNNSAVPILSGVLAAFVGWRSAFAIGLVSSTIAFLLVLLWTDRDSARHATGIAPASSGVKPAGVLELRTGGALLLAACVATFAVFYGRFALISTMLPLIGADLVGASPSTIGLAIGVMNGTMLVATLLGGWASDRFARFRILLPGMVLMVICQSSIFLISNDQTYLIAAGLAGFGNLMSPVPASLIGDTLPARLRAQGMLLYRVTGDIAVFSAPLLVGLGPQLGGFTAGEAAVVLPVALALLLLVAVRPQYVRQAANVSS
jgi:predicted MFS family arabinose efflux permease